MTSVTAPPQNSPYTATVFTYDSYQITPAENRLTCRYRLDDWTFTEQVTLPAGGDWSTPAARAAARLVFLLAAVSYYKAGAPPVIDLGEHAVTDTEREFLRQFYVDGLGEFAYRSTPRLDLTALEIRGPRLERAAPAPFDGNRGTPLIPFGGGVDSIVTVELLRAHAPSPSLFVVNRPGDRFEAIERPAAVTGLPVVRAERLLDPQILRSAELGFRNGHVPVTGVISAIAVLAAAVGGHDAVVMSNEWSASSETIEIDGRSINHQYSKSEAFEAGFRQVIAEAIGGSEAPRSGGGDSGGGTDIGSEDFSGGTDIDGGDAGVGDPDRGGAEAGSGSSVTSKQSGLQYFSLLRPFTELWIARRFAGLQQYFQTFRSCNRAFHINPAQRLDHWCARCDKCCFIDLILSPFLDASVLRRVFAGGGAEPLENPDLLGQFDTLLGLVPGAKPWECVGDVGECQVAAQLASARPDRAGSPILTSLVTRLGAAGGRADDTALAAAEALLQPVGRHFIPEAYLPDELRG